MWGGGISGWGTTTEYGMMAAHVFSTRVDRTQLRLENITLMNLARATQSQKWNFQT